MYALSFSDNEKENKNKGHIVFSRNQKQNRMLDSI